MAKKAKRAKKGKKKGKNKKKNWCTEDLDFDEDGNLVVKNPALAKALEKAIYRADRRFKIRIDRAADSDRPGAYDRVAARKGDPIDGVKSEDDGGRPPANAMCPC